MKRIAYLTEKIAENENLYKAWVKARKGKDEKENVLNFEKNLDKNLFSIKNQILSGDIKLGDYHYFTISDPKVRQICAASFPERVLHHAIMNICDKYFEKHFIFDTYATRKNKGTYAALDRAKYFIRNNKYFVKLDVRKYFDNIDHKILIKQLIKLFKDQKLIDIFQKIINSYSVSVGKGVPIGNLTSQYFANYYLSGADHFAKEFLKIKTYIRYMDDVIFFGNDKIILKQQYEKYKTFLDENLKLELKQLILDKSEKGVSFLGYKIFPFYIKLNKRSKLRFKRKAKEFKHKFENNQWAEKEYQQHLLPLLAFVDYADTFNLKKKTFMGECRRL